MKSSSIPTKFNIPFASSAGSSYIRDIPQASQIGITDGAASLTDGFPPDCFSPVAAGGVPPFGQDFNGILNQVTSWLQWNQAGGSIPYDATFQTAIGGYPNGAIVQVSGSPGVFWLSTADNNLTTPGATGASWTNILGSFATQSWANGQFLPLTGGTLTGSLSIDTGSLVVTTPGSGSGGLILTQHNGSDTSGNARWGGEFTSAIGGASVSSINLYVNELVGNTTRADLQINFAGGSGRSDFYFDQSGSITGPSGAFALQSALTSEANTRASADATKVSKSGDTMTGSLTLQNSSLYCGYGAGWLGNTSSGGLRYTNGALWWGNPSNVSPVAFAGLLQVTDIVGNANADQSGLNFGGYDYAGNRHDWYLAWNGNVTTPAGKLALQSQLPTNPVQGTSSGELIQSFTFTGNNNTTISFPRAFSGTPSSVNLTVSSDTDADHYAMNWTSSGFFLGIFGGASNVQFSCIVVGPA